MDSNTCPAYYDDFPGAGVVVVMLLGILLEYVLIPCISDCCHKPKEIERITHECGYTEERRI